MTPDVVIIGAGAAGLMCAIAAGQRGRRVLVLEHTHKIAEKIRISGGGRCNFTNLHCAPDRYLSQNPHFCRSALSRYTQHDFIALVARHGIAYHEKTLGQLFCDHSAGDIINALLKDCKEVGVEIRTGTSVSSIKKEDTFIIESSAGKIEAESVVIATGGLSIPKIGATPFGYEIAKQFGLGIIPTRAGLVPLTFDPHILDHTKALSGVAVDPARVKSEDGMHFDEAILFTHRGVSGPAILQISSYWEPGQAVSINMMPGQDALEWLKEKRKTSAKSQPHTVLADVVPSRLAQTICDEIAVQGRMADQSDKVLQTLAIRLGAWAVKPSGSEGYRTAEVTLGGVDTNDLSSKTMEAKAVPGLFFIGEVVDVTGHLGGFNFQWAWASGWCAGQYA